MRDAAVSVSAPRHASGKAAHLTSNVAHIAIEGLSLRYRGKKDSVLALDNISFDIPPRSFVSIVGRSGCGKTTLLKVLSGVLKPSEGRVTMDGAALSATNIAGKIGFVFQRLT